MLILRECDYNYDDFTSEYLEELQGIKISILDRYHNHTIGDKNIVDTGILEDIFDNEFKRALYDYEDYEEDDKKEGFKVLKQIKDDINKTYNLNISISQLYINYMKNYNINNEESNFYLYQKLFNKNYKIYESRGYNQGDFAYIMYDADLYDIDYIEYIDALLWGKYSNFDLIEDDEFLETYQILHDYTFSDNILIDYIKNDLGLKVDAIERIDNYITVPTYKKIVAWDKKRLKKGLVSPWSLKNR